MKESRNMKFFGSVVKVVIYLSGIVAGYFVTMCAFHSSPLGIGLFFGPLLVAIQLYNLRKMVDVRWPEYAAEAKKTRPVFFLRGIGALAVGYIGYRFIGVGRLGEIFYAVCAIHASWSWLKMAFNDSWDLLGELEGIN